MKNELNFGKGMAGFKLTGPLAVVVLLVYILIWLLIGVAMIETAWAVVFGGLLG